jgi:hypothetical protein
MAGVSNQKLESIDAGSQMLIQMARHKTSTDGVVQKVYQLRCVP